MPMIALANRDGLTDSNVVQKLHGVNSLLKPVFATWRKT